MPPAKPKSKTAAKLPRPTAAPLAAVVLAAGQGTRMRSKQPKVMHKVRVFNKTEQPFTTAPALLIREGRAIGQSMMTYTARGAAVDIPVTTAVDIKVKKTVDAFAIERPFFFTKSEIESMLKLISPLTTLETRSDICDEIP